MSKYYVSLYELYPIYEPAEGGYYYNGVQLVGYNEFSTKKKAMRCFNRYLKERKANTAIETTWKKEEIRVDENGYDWYQSKLCNLNTMHFGAINRSLIGEGWFIQIERKLGKSESGWHPYE